MAKQKSHITAAALNKIACTTNELRPSVRELQIPNWSYRQQVKKKKKPTSLLYF